MKTIGIIVGACILIYISYRVFRFINLDNGLKEKVSKGAVVLDVRTPWEFETGHIKGAVNIPLSQLHADSIPLDKHKTYITVCSHGLRSVKAMNLLKEEGYQHVYNGGTWSDLESELK